MLTNNHFPTNLILYSKNYCSNESPPSAFSFPFVPQDKSLMLQNAKISKVWKYYGE